MGRVVALISRLALLAVAYAILCAVVALVGSAATEHAYLGRWLWTMRVGANFVMPIALMVALGTLLTYGRPSRPPDA